MDTYESSLKVLFALSTPTPEVEDDMDNDFLADQAIAQYDFMNVIAAIGDETFREIYTCFKNVIILEPHKNQIDFCRALIDRIQEVYDFEFQPIDYDYEQPTDIYEFVEWLEYDNDEFIFDIFDGIISNDINNIDIRATVEDEWENIEKKILSISVANGFKSEFIRTNNKENIIDFIVRNAEKNKSLIRERFFMKADVS